MRTPLASLLALLLLASPPALRASPETDLGQRVWVRPLSVHTWLVRSISKLDSFGDVESNAVLVVGPAESVLIDTPATNQQTETVLAWAEKELRRPVRHLIVTHWHADRMGGIDAARARTVSTYAFGKTREIARQKGLTVPGHELNVEEHLTLSAIRIETFYPGHGHTVDNIVVWLAEDQLLDGGCFLKDAPSKTLGNVQEANPAQWASGVATLQRRYPKAKLVIPGHGAVGGLDLLAHTAELISKRRN